MAKIRKYRSKKSVFFDIRLWLNALLMLIGAFGALWLLTHLIKECCLVNRFVRYLLSFTNNSEYRVAYIELWGALFGSFIAVYGAVWLQRRTERKNEEAEWRKYARIAYYDFDFAFKDLLKIYKDAKENLGITQITVANKKRVYNFISTEGRKLHFNQNWIVDMAQLGEALTHEELKLAYDIYGKLVDIDEAIQSGDANKIKNIFDKEEYVDALVDGNKGEVKTEAQELLEKLKKTFT